MWGATSMSIYDIFTLFKSISYNDPLYITFLNMIFIHQVTEPMLGQLSVYWSLNDIFCGVPLDLYCKYQVLKLK